MSLLHGLQRRLRAELAAHASDGLVGVSCLARGADQLFARAVLELGGALEVVLPAADYRGRKVKPDNAAAFDELIGQATIVRTLPFATSNRDSYLAASEHVLSTVELMVAVWDGQPADGHGGTGDVVERARALGLPGHSGVAHRNRTRIVAAVLTPLGCGWVSKAVFTTVDQYIWHRLAR